MTAINTKAIHRILVIDDNPSIHEDFQKIFAKARHNRNDLVEMETALFGSGTGPSITPEFEIDCAFQGSEALEMVLRAKSEGCPYAVVFVDGRMPPGWDGVETIRHLWRECPELQVVLCTAYADYSWQQIRHELGENDSLLILKKPFDNVEVLQLAHALTRKWELNREVRSRIENLDELVKQRTEEKNQTRALLEAALEHSPMGIVICNAKGSEILWTNPAAMQICGIESSAPEPEKSMPIFSGLAALQTDGSPYPSGEFPPFQSAKKGKIVREKEFLLRDAHKRDRWISYNTAPIRKPDGSILASIVILQDVTKRRYAQRERERLQQQLNQAQKMESVGLLAGGIAHDYNNMIGVILGSIELALEESIPTSSIHENLETIQRAAKRSSNLTQQLLSFARKQIAKPKVLNINEKIKDSLNMLRRVVGENIDIFLRPVSKPWPVNIDPTQVDQILINLCLNARDAIDGIGEISIETKNEVVTEEGRATCQWLLPGDYVSLIVTDNGCGIEKEHIDRIFEPFFTRKARGDGTGLGLASVYGIVKQNKGFITVDSKSGKGSVFKILLPRSRKKTGKPVLEAAKKNEKGRGEMVLIVEDEEDILAMSRKIVERLGYSALVANKPTEALHVAEANAGKIQLLMTDVIMPEMNGRDLANRILSNQPNMKCLYVSGYSDDIIAKHGIMDEGVHFLQKPFSIKELSDKIRETLGVL